VVQNVVTSFANPTNLRATALRSGEPAGGPRIGVSATLAGLFPSCLPRTEAKPFGSAGHIRPTKSTKRCTCIDGIDPRPPEHADDQCPEVRLHGVLGSSASGILGFSWFTSQRDRPEKKPSSRRRPGPSGAKPVLAEGRFAEPLNTAHPRARAARGCLPARSSPAPPSNRPRRTPLRTRRSPRA
jgi:hypothetical protein